MLFPLVLGCVYSPSDRTECDASILSLLDSDLRFVDKEKSSLEIRLGDSFDSFSVSPSDVLSLYLSQKVPIYCSEELDNDYYDHVAIFGIDIEAIVLNTPIFEGYANKYNLAEAFLTPDFSLNSSYICTQFDQGASLADLYDSIHEYFYFSLYPSLETLFHEHTHAALYFGGEGYNHSDPGVNDYMDFMESSIHDEVLEFYSDNISNDPVLYLGATNE